MTEVDCAGNNILAEELKAFLTNENYSVTKENDLVTIDEKFAKSILESCLKQTGNVRHTITPVDSNSYSIAIHLYVDVIGLEY